MTVTRGTGTNRIITHGSEPGIGSTLRVNAWIAQTLKGLFKESSSVYCGVLSIRKIYVINHN